MTQSFLFYKLGLYKTVEKHTEIFKKKVLRVNKCILINKIKIQECTFFCVTNSSGNIYNLQTYFINIDVQCNIKEITL